MNLYFCLYVMPMVSNEYEPFYIERKLYFCMKTSSYIYMKYAKPTQGLMVTFVSP
jgi:hypothetical protein